MLDFKRKKLLENKRNPLIYPAFFGNPEPPIECVFTDLVVYGGIGGVLPNDALQFSNMDCVDVCVNIQVINLTAPNFPISEVIYDLTDQIVTGDPYNISFLGDPVLMEGQQYRIVVTSCDGLITYLDVNRTAV